MAYNLPVSRRWDDVMLTQFHHTVATAPSAELIVSSSTTGMDLALFYIRKTFILVLRGRH